MWVYTDDGTRLVDLSAMECIAIHAKKRGGYAIQAYPYDSEGGYTISHHYTIEEAQEELAVLKDGLNAGWED